MQVTEGMELLSPRTEAEDKKLKGKPDSWRLACQSLVGGRAWRILLATSQGAF